jgi:hypothetical protein
VIERNVMWRCGDHAIQSAADAVIRNNIILGSGSDGIAMQPHQSGSPANMVVIHNTVLHATNDAISLRGTAGSVTIANNALYAQNGDAILVSGGDVSGVVLAGNVGVGGVSGASGGLSAGDLAADLVDGHYVGAPPIDVFPEAGGGLLGAAVAAHAAEDDFNGTLREGSLDVGAYVFATGGNPGWVLTEGFKGFTPTSPGGDGGATPGGGDGGGDGTADGGGPGATGDGEGGCGCWAVSGRLAPGGPAVVLVLAILRRRRRPAVHRPAGS